MSAISSNTPETRAIQSTKLTTTLIHANHAPRQIRIRGHTRQLSLALLEHVDVHRGRRQPAPQDLRAGRCRRAIDRLNERQIEITDGAAIQPRTPVRDTAARRLCIGESPSLHRIGAADLLGASHVGAA